MNQDKQEVNYRFTYKDAHGKMGATVISIWEKDCDKAIEAFEKLYPRVVWRRFECLDKTIHEQPNTILLSEAFEFIEFLMNGFSKSETRKGMWIMKIGLIHEYKTTQELFNLYQEQKK